MIQSRPTVRRQNVTDWKMAWNMTSFSFPGALESTWLPASKDIPCVYIYKLENTGLFWLADEASSVCVLRNTLAGSKNRSQAPGLAVQAGSRLPCLIACSCMFRACVHQRSTHEIHTEALNMALSVQEFMFAHTRQDYCTWMHQETKWRCEERGRHAGLEAPIVQLKSQSHPHAQPNASKDTALTLLLQILDASLKQGRANKCHGGRSEKRARFLGRLARSHCPLPCANPFVKAIQRRGQHLRLQTRSRQVYALSTHVMLAISLQPYGALLLPVLTTTSFATCRLASRVANGMRGADQE